MMDRNDLDQLSARLDYLTDVDRLTQLKARYTRLADDKYTPDQRRVDNETLAIVAQAQADCFTEDAVWRAGDGFGGDLNGRRALADFFARPPWTFAIHYYLSPSLRIEGDRAWGSWRLWQFARRRTDQGCVLLAAITHEQYRRSGTCGWLISEMCFEQLHTVDLGNATDSIVSSFLPPNATRDLRALYK